MRYVVSILAGIVMSILLFWLMQGLVANKKSFERQQDAGCLSFRLRSGNPGESEPHLQRFPASGAAERRRLSGSSARRRRVAVEEAAGERA